MYFVVASNPLIEFEVERTPGSKMSNTLSWPSIEKLFKLKLRPRMVQGAPELGAAIYPEVHYWMIAASFHLTYKILIAFPHSFLHK